MSLNGLEREQAGATLALSTVIEMSNVINVLHLTASGTAQVQRTSQIRPLTAKSDQP